jgi:signal transduction histidine kinase
MTSLEENMNYPGGILSIDGEGLIRSAPRTFLEAADARVGVDSIFSLFDESRTPFLQFTRIHKPPRRPHEFHLKVLGGTTDAYFRYWEKGESKSQSNYFIVDDTSIVEEHQRAFRQFRTRVVSDTQEFLATHFQGRIAALKTLAEVLRDAPLHAVESSGRILSLIEGLSDGVNRLSGHMETLRGKIGDHSSLDLEEVVEIVRGWSNEYCKVQCEMAQSTILDRKVPERLVHHVVKPLVQNAIESKPVDRMVRVVVRTVDPNKVCFELTDKGIGMTAQELLRAEDPFYSTKAGHLGMGMSQAKAELLHIGGYWTLQSVPHRGTYIRVNSPME